MISPLNMKLLMNKYIMNPIVILQETRLKWDNISIIEVNKSNIPKNMIII